MDINDIQSASTDALYEAQAMIAKEIHERAQADLVMSVRQAIKEAPELQLLRDQAVKITFRALEWDNGAHYSPGTSRLLLDDGIEVEVDLSELGYLDESLTDLSAAEAPHHGQALSAGDTVTVDLVTGQVTQSYWC